MSTNVIQLFKTASQQLSRNELVDVYRIATSEGSVHIALWNRRFRETNEKLRDGSPRMVAEVYRDMRALRTVKDLSFGEKKMMERAEQLLREFGVELDSCVGGK